MNNFKININFLDVQKKSFFNFISGLNNESLYSFKNLLNAYFPIGNLFNNFFINFVDFYFIDPNLDIYTLKLLNQTYEFILFLILNFKQILILDNINYELNDIRIIYFNKLPFMIKNASFLINGDEKVIVHQIQRSSGIYFEIEKSNNDKSIISAKIIPTFGSWLEIELYNNKIYIRIDNSVKFPLSTFFYALKFNKDEIIDIFKTGFTIFIQEYKIYIKYDKELFLNHVSKFNLFLNNVCYFRKGQKINEFDIIKIEKLCISFFEILEYDLFGCRLLEDVVINNKCYKKNSYINKSFILKIKFLNNFIFNIIYNDKFFLYIEKNILNTIVSDKNKNYDNAVNFLLKSILVNQQYKYHDFKNIIFEKFFNINNYNLSYLGRLKLNNSISNYSKDLFLNIHDIVLTVRKLISIKKKKTFLEDKDNLFNRRVQFIDELIYNQFYSVLNKFLDFINLECNFCFKKINNFKSCNNVLYDFFNVNPLCQFMDQINALSEISHKRRLTSLGSSNLTKDNTSFDIRDVNFSHYGKICPIETPEGQNIGLINSLSLYAKGGSFGFISSPYFLVFNGYVTDVIHYINSLYENQFIIAQFNTHINKDGNILDDKILCRNFGCFKYFNKKIVNYMDISSQQILSVAASLVPFLGHNDANRVLMGCNMQKQSIPLLFPEDPMVITGNENALISSLYYNIYSNISGIVKYIDSKFILIVDDDNNKEIYFLNKYERTNQNTLIHQRCVVNLNDYVYCGQLIAESACSNNDKLSIGKNIKVAFMSFCGLNFEDAIIISERLIINESFTSVNIFEIDCSVKNTKYGIEELTNDVIFLNKYYLRHLGSDGIVKIGSYVSEGDVLVGKLTPIEIVEYSPETKLIMAIFKNKIKKSKNSSLRVPKGMFGEVVDVNIIFKTKKKFMEKNTKEINYWINICNKKKYSIFYSKQLLSLPFDILIKYFNFSENDKKYYDLANNNNNNVNNYISTNLDSNIIQLIKIKIAVKRRLKIGDKMSGRYGNKGVISKILPIVDMPYDKDGNPIDVILSPLGVPSRMNIGQLIEVYFSVYLENVKNNIKKLYNINDIDNLESYINTLYSDKYITINLNVDNIKKNFNNLDNYLNKTIFISIPSFINIDLDSLDLDLCNKSLFDGKTGVMFPNKITVGYMYLMRLNHLSDDKIHARSVGSYSLITQQPLGGKSQFGGQRFGEMEVWALEAYGAAYTLNEMLTIKSDDLSGRIKLYKNLVKGDSCIETTSTESFNLLLNEIKSLGFNIQLVTKS